MNCRQVSRYLLDYVDNGGIQDLKDEIDEHIQQCSRCRVDYFLTKVENEVLRQPFAMPEVPADFSARVMQQISVQPEKTMPSESIEPNRGRRPYLKPGLIAVAVVLLFFIGYRGEFFDKFMFGSKPSQIADIGTSLKEVTEPVKTVTMLPADKPPPVRTNENLRRQEAEPAIVALKTEERHVENPSEGAESFEITFAGEADFNENEIKVIKEDSAPISVSSLIEQDPSTLSTELPDSAPQKSLKVISVPVSTSSFKIALSDAVDKEIKETEKRPNIMVNSFPLEENPPMMAVMPQAIVNTEEKNKIEKVGAVVEEAELSAAEKDEVDPVFFAPSGVPQRYSLEKQEDLENATLYYYHDQTGRKLMIEIRETATDRYAENSRRTAKSVVILAKRYAGHDLQVILSGDIDWEEMQEISCGISIRER